MSYDIIPESVYDGLGPRGRAIAEYYLTHPKATTPQIAEQFGVSPSRVRAILVGNRFLKALRMATVHKVRFAMNRAADTLIECLDSTSEDVRLKSATKILENEGVLGPDKVNLEINDMRNVPLSKLIEIASQPIDPVMLEIAKREENLKQESKNTDKPQNE